MEAECVAMECKHSNSSDRKCCSVIVRDGTLNVGDFLVAGANYGKVSRMLDDRGEVVTCAGPGSAVEISGLKVLPDGGEKLFCCKTEKEASTIAECRGFLNNSKQALSELDNLTVGTKLVFETRKERRMFIAGRQDVVNRKYEEMLENMKEGSFTTKSRKGVVREKKLTEDAEKIHTNFINTFRDQSEDVKKIIVKASDYGTVETIQDHIAEIKDKNGDQHFEVLKYEVGGITETDLLECMEFQGDVYCMDITPSKEIEAQAQMENIPIHTYNIIYKLFEDLKELNETIATEKSITVDVKGSALVQQIFEINLNKSMKLKIAGLKVSDGYLKKNLSFRLLRDGMVVNEDLEAVS